MSELKTISLLKYSFKDVPTIKAFVKSRKKYKYLQGPIGSGKSSGCVIHLFLSMLEQEPDSQGRRKTRFAIIRNTQKQLIDTTKKTIDYWIPHSLYTWKEAKSKYEFKFALDDGTIIESEWLLRPLDDPNQVRDLLSLELTGAWVNEAREIEWDIFNMLRGRIDRYPPKADGGPTYSFIILDSNPPDTEHWLYKFFVEWPQADESLRELVGFFKQPSGRSSQAENLSNLPENYYQDLMIGQDDDFIRVYVDGEFGVTRVGKPVFSNYRDSLHYRDEEFIPKPYIQVVIGMDFGLYPACVFTQYQPNGQLCVFDEIVSLEPTDLQNFIENRLLPKINAEYYRNDILIIGDPAGQARSQIDSKTCYHLLREYGLRAYPAWTNTLHDRIMAVNTYLTRMVEGEPAFLLFKRCQMLRKALNSEYKFKRLRVAGERYSELPEKNLYSHIADALQYACLSYTLHSKREELIKGYDIRREFSERKYSYEAFI